ncbi:MAG: histidine kinase [Marinilabiliaceae bacterium]|nr:histidine kinase [Marinilabiliaceae bacterium]
MLTNRYKIFLIPFITIVMMLTSISLMFLFGFRTLEDLQAFALRRILYVLGNATITVVIFYYVVNWFNKHAVWSEKWFIRLLMDMALILVHSAIFISIANYVANAGYIEVSDRVKEHTREFLYVVPLMMNTLFLVLIEMILAMEERNKLALQVAQLEKEQINAKYGALKEQLDHHFLFNNLSVLSSLIYEDVEKADHFIQDFSSTYRYVLQINQRNLVTVKEELAFIENYLNLYKFRFEEGFEYVLKAAPERLKWKVPPLTLQVLVENAIKHNQISRQHPLHLEIKCCSHQLTVSNSIQPKQEKTDSTQTGQINLVEKYRLLGDALPEFKIEANTYIAQIPLIEPNEK